MQPPHNGFTFFLIIPAVFWTGAQINMTDIRTHGHLRVAQNAINPPRIKAGSTGHRIAEYFERRLIIKNQKDLIMRPSAVTGHNHSGDGLADNLLNAVLRTPYPPPR